MTRDTDGWIGQYKQKGALWIHDGNMRRPHALLTSGKHSSGFFNSRLVIPDEVLLRDAAAEDARLADLLTRPLDDAEVGEALTLLRGHDAVARARQVARQWADDARECLEPLPAGAARDALAAVCDYVVDRTG